MQITKMHGLGNDFVMYSPKKEKDRDYAKLAKEICARRTSVGADGLVVVLSSETCDARMRIINSDGSEAEMCGNGIRCFAKYVYEKGIVKKTEMTVETLAGTIRPKVILDQDTVVGVEVDMGKPIFDPALIPTTIPEDEVLSSTVTMAGRTFDIACVNSGVPHTMVFVDKMDTDDVYQFGPLIEKHELFPQNTNVNFVEVVDKENIVVSTWERGAGKTMACGTGCCAAVVACAKRGLTGRNVTVKLE
ncbi:MAG: diaminopimelate epimerase, partial [Eubacteriales bacterium]